LNDFEKITKEKKEIESELIELKASIEKGDSELQKVNSIQTNEINQLSKFFLQLKQTIFLQTNTKQTI